MSSVALFAVVAAIGIGMMIGRHEVSDLFLGPMTPRHHQHQEQSEAAEPTAAAAPVYVPDSSRDRRGKGQIALYKQQPVEELANALFLNIRMKLTATLKDMFEDSVEGFIPHYAGNDAALNKSQIMEFFTYRFASVSTSDIASTMTVVSGNSISISALDWGFYSNAERTVYSNRSSFFLVTNATSDRITTFIYVVNDTASNTPAVKDKILSIATEMEASYASQKQTDGHFDLFTYYAGAHATKFFATDNGNLTAYAAQTKWNEPGGYEIFSYTIAHNWIALSIGFYANVRKHDRFQTLTREMHVMRIVPNAEAPHGGWWIDLLYGNLRAACDPMRPGVLCHWGRAPKIW